MKYNSYHIKQQTENDCGIAVVSSVLTYYGTHHNYSYIRDLHFTDGEYTLRDIKLLLERFGYDGKAVKHVGEDIKSSLEELSTPFIAHVQNKERRHYVVVYEVEENGVVISDPSEKRPNKLNFNEFDEIITGVFIEVHPIAANEAEVQEERLRSGYSMKSFFLELLKNNRRALVTVIVFSIAFLLLTVLNSMFFKLTIDYIIPNRNIRTLHLLLIGFVAVNVLFTLFGFARSQIIVRLSNHMDLHIADDYFKHMMHVGLDFHDKRNSGELISRYEDSLQIREILNKSVIGNVLDVTIAVAASSILLFTNVQIFGLTMGACIAFLLITALYFNVIARRAKKYLEAKAEVNSFLVQFLGKMNSILSFNKTSYVHEGIVSKIKSEQRALYKLRTTENQSGALKTLLMNVFFLVIVWYGTLQIINGSLSLGDLVLYVTLLNFIIASVNNLINTQVELQEALVTINRFKDYLGYPVQPEGDKDVEDILSVEAHELKYGYNLKETLIECDSFEIERGERIYLHGKSGSGKSTFTKLLANLLTPTEGVIFVNGEDIRTYTNSSLRRAVTYVSNEPLILDGTIYENVSMGDTVDPDEVIRALEIVQLNDHIQKLPQGIETTIYEEGGNLSSGQKQRLNLARALVQGHQLLIMDEALSHVDEDTVHTILAEISNSQSMMIYISHRNLSKEYFHKTYRFDTKEEGSLTHVLTLDELGEQNRTSSTSFRREGMESHQPLTPLLEKYSQTDFGEDLRLILDIDKLEKELPQDTAFNEDTFIKDYEKVITPSIACCIMTYNEEKTIRRVLQSISSYFDSVIVLDSYSTDRTTTIIEEEFPDTELISLEWENDFSYHRNRLIEYAHTDWVYFIDADNYIPNHENVAKLGRIAKVITYLGLEESVALSPLIQEHNGRVTFDNRRFFSNRSGIRFEGTVHEEPVLPGGGETIGIHMDFEVAHDGYEPTKMEEKQKVSRNINLMKQMMESGKVKPKWYYFYARDLYHADPVHKADEALRYLEVGRTQADSTNTSSYLLDNLMLKTEICIQHRRLEEAREAVSELEAKFPDLADTHYMRALIMLNELQGKVGSFLASSRDDLTENPNAYSVIQPNFQHIDELYTHIAESLNLSDLATRFKENQRVK